MLLYLSVSDQELLFKKIILLDILIIQISKLNQNKINFC